jgi:hypothetical protein
MATKQNDPSFFILSTHRIMFPHLDVPHKFQDDDDKEDSEPKYDCTWLIPVNHPDAQALMVAMQAMHAQEALSKFKGMPFEQIGQPDGIWCPLRSGDAYADKMIARGKDPVLYEPYRGHYFIKATSDVKFPPVVFMQLDQDPRGRHEVMDIKKELYSGCYARGVLKGLGWNNKGKYGFSFFINSVCKTAEGPKLGGFSASADDYDQGADYTDRSVLLPGEAPVATGFAMPGMPPAALPGIKTPGTMPQMPGVPPAAQRPPLPGMTPAAPVYTPPVYQPPVYTPPAPVYQPPAIAPMYNQQDGKPIVSFDGGASWEWVI